MSITDSEVRDDAGRASRRDQVAGTLFGTWVVAGLFVDGWAHNVDKPEDFFTPWHALLYSGFVAATLWFAVDGVRQRAAGTYTPPPRQIVWGFALFAIGGVADGVWHQVFGVEVDLEALLSPTHMTLMFGGLLLVTQPLREALADADRTPSLRRFLPQVVSLTLAVGIVAFFLQFANAFRIWDHGVFDATASEGMQTTGVSLVLIANVIVLGAVAWTLRHWRPPFGTFAIVIGGSALLMSGLKGFDQAWLVLPALAAGLTADALVARGASPRTVLIATPAVLWLAWFATYHAVWGLGWPAELWTGTVFFTVLTGFALSLLSTPPFLASSSRPDRNEEAKKGANEGTGGVAQAPRRTPYRAMAELLV